MWQKGCAITCHHLLNDFNGISGRLGKAKPDDGVQPCRMAVVADVVPLDAAGLAALLLVADGALHEFIVLEILQRSLAYQTLFFHHLDCLLCQCIAQSDSDYAKHYTAQSVQNECGIIASLQQAQALL